jgi:hypothetical protein
VFHQAASHDGDGRAADTTAGIEGRMPG